MNHGPRNSKPVKKPSGQAGAAYKSPVRKGHATRARKPGSKKRDVNFPLLSKCFWARWERLR